MIFRFSARKFSEIFQIAACVFWLLAIVLTIGTTRAADLRQATVTQVVNDVDLLAPGRDASPASVGSQFGGNTAIVTGRRSRAELEFSDTTLMRIGSSTTFSISGGRSVDLQRGALLLQTPEGGRSGNGVRVRAGSVTAAITGSMGLVSLSAPTERDRRDKELYFKFISVHGDMHVEIGGKRYDVKPFQLLFLRLDLDGNVIGEPVITTLDGAKLLASSKLLEGFKDQTRLAQAPIDQQTSGQSQQKSGNEWTSVTGDSHRWIPGLFRSSILGRNALIPPPQPPVLPTPPPPAPTPKPVVVRPAPAPVVTPAPAPKPVVIPAPAPAPTPEPRPPIDTGGGEGGIGGDIGGDIGGSTSTRFNGGTS